MEGYGGIKVPGQQQRAELAAAVQKTVCNLARKELTCMTGSIGVDIAMVVDEVRRLRTDLQSAKARAEDAITQLHHIMIHMHTGLMVITIAAAQVLWAVQEFADGSPSSRSSQRVDGAEMMVTP